MNKKQFKSLDKKARNEAWLRHLSFSRWLSVCGVSRCEWHYLALGRKPRKAVTEKLEKLQGGYKK